MTTTSFQTPFSTDVPQLAQQLREQFLATLAQGQALSLQAAEGWAKAVSAVPFPELPAVPAVPGLPTVPGVEAATTYAFDIATDVLKAQRDFSLQLVHVLVPATAA